MYTDSPTHPPAEKVCQYLHNYAINFDLHKHIKLRTTIMKIERSENDNSWILQYEEDGIKQTEEFGKLVMATGSMHDPVMPEIPGADKFKGTFIHAQAFKEYGSCLSRCCP